MVKQEAQYPAALGNELCPEVSLSEEQTVELTLFRVKYSTFLNVVMIIFKYIIAFLDFIPKGE